MKNWCAIGLFEKYHNTCMYYVCFMSPIFCSLQELPVPLRVSTIEFRVRIGGVHLLKPPSNSLPTKVTLTMYFGQRYRNVRANTLSI